ncbi:MAG: TonB-dependent receptor plug domain-containing protein [Burkholderiales bacterium]
MNTIAHARKRPPCRFFRSLTLSAALLASAPAAWADGAGNSAKLTDLTLEQLLQTEVVSAGKKPQKVDDTAAAIFVLTREDIRRSGLTSVPELLRLVPGLEVAQINADTWAISSRGFNQRFSDKLLVMLDGRTLYSPTFAGVYWDSQDVMLEDIDRIEVIRGPGGTLWGANAVNGVINIITRPAVDTQGLLASAGGGNQERQESLRYGGTIGGYGHYRVFAKNSARNAFEQPGGASAGDPWAMHSAGFRADWGLPGGDSVSLGGNAYDGNDGLIEPQASLTPPYTQTTAINTRMKGRNLSLRWSRALSPASDWTLQAYWDSTERSDPFHTENRDTFDVDFQRRFPIGRRHDIVWGLGYRQTHDTQDPSFFATFTPASRTDRTASAFAQDEIALIPDRLHLILGSKFEHNDYTGTEYQPDARLRWKIDERQNAWIAVSRAIRTPPRAHSDILVNLLAFPGSLGVTNVVSIEGNPNLASEKLLALEAGYRVHPSQRIALDVSAFYNDYRDVEIQQPQAPFFVALPLPHLVLATQFQNAAQVRSHGLEFSGNWQVSGQWTLKASYSWLEMRYSLDPNAQDSGIEPARGGNDPQHQFKLQSHLALGGKTDLETSLYRVNGPPAQLISAYTRVDARLGWRAARDLEIALDLRNLFDNRHPEFFAQGYPATSEVPRSAYLSATWGF